VVVIFRFTDGAGAGHRRAHSEAHSGHAARGAAGEAERDVRQRGRLPGVALAESVHRDDDEGAPGCRLALACSKIRSSLAPADKTLSSHINSAFMMPLFDVESARLGFSIPTHVSLLVVSSSRLMRGCFEAGRCAASESAGLFSLPPLRAQIALIFLSRYMTTTDSRLRLVVSSPTHSLRSCNPEGAALRKTRLSRFDDF
jgi:hypothetical protein